MKKHQLFTLPYPSTSTIQEPRLLDKTEGLYLSMICDDDGSACPVSVLFVKPRAFRKRTEVYCKEWHIKDLYDTVCEIGESDWVTELRNDAVPEWRDRWVMRHFMIYVDSFGCLEVIAESAELSEMEEKDSSIL